MMPYYVGAGGAVTLYLGDMREVITAVGSADLILADPPYSETSLRWDRWPDDWLACTRGVSRAMWCFGSLRAIGPRWVEFTANGWRFSQDLVWEKHNGSGFLADRFRRVHEHVTFWYRGNWDKCYKDVPVTNDAVARTLTRSKKPAHMGDIERGHYQTEDGGPRLMRSVLHVRSMHRRAIHPTEKPVALLEPLITYACPPGGTVLDPFAGSGASAVAALATGRKAVLIEQDERFCAAIATRIEQFDLDRHRSTTDPDAIQGQTDIYDALAR